MIAKMINYKTILHYTIRIHVEIEEPEKLIKALRECFSNEYSDYRIVRAFDDYDIAINDLEFKLRTDEDSIFISFAQLKVGYRDVLNEIKRMNEIVNKLLRLVPSYEHSVFKCEIKFENRNPYLTLFLDTKMRHEENVCVSIDTGNSKVTNDGIVYWQTDIVEFNNKLEKELLLK